MLKDKLYLIVKPIVEDLGCELVGIEHVPQARSALLRIYLDHPKGLSMDICSKASRQIGFALDLEEELLKMPYDLEVSSPGVNRKIFNVEQLKKFIGKQVKIKLRQAIDGQKSFTGQLLSVMDNIFTMDINGASMEFDFDDAALVNLITLSE